MEELKKTIEALQRAFEAFKKANDERLKQIEEKGHADPLVTAEVARINGELTKISAMRDQLEKLENLVARGPFPGGQDSPLDKARADHKKAFAAFIRRGLESGLRDLEIAASLSTSDDTGGGFLSPETLDAEVDRVAGTVSAMRSICTVMPINTKAYTKIVNVGGTSSGWVGEKETRTETDTPSLVEIVVNAKEVYAMPASTQEALEDTIIDVEAWLAGEVGIEFAEEEGDKFINGNGVKQPMGLMSYTPVANASYAWGKIGYIASGAAADIDDTEKLISLQHALKAIYRQDSTFLMADSTLEVLRKLKYGNGEYIFVPGIQAGAPDTLLGRPIVIDDNMPVVGADTYPIAYGNFRRAYLIVDRRGVRVIRDDVTQKGYVLFYTTKRVGGGIVMYEAVKLLKCSA